MFKLHSFKIPQTIIKSQFRTITSSNYKSQKPPFKRHKRKLKPKPIPFLTDLKQLHDSNEALDLFTHYTQIGFKHDFPSYSSLLYKLARSRNFHHIDPLLDFIKKRGIRCNETLFMGLSLVVNCDF